MYFIIRDILTGKGRHKFTFFFHFETGADVKRTSESIFETQFSKGANLIMIPLLQNDFEYKIFDGWVSKSYGIKEKAKILKCEKSEEVPFTCTFILYPFSGIRPNLDQLEKIKNSAFNLLDNLHIH